MKNTEARKSELGRLDRGPGLAEYAEWKSATSSEACLSSEVSIQEVSSSVPSYPVQRTRYNSLQVRQQLSIFESSISKISNLGSLSTVIGGGGGECNQGSDSESLVPAWKRGIPGVQHEDCLEVIV